MDGTVTRLSSLEYPGRLIVVGAPRRAGTVAFLYAITGRSPSSQARRLVLRDGGIWVQPTDEETLKTGRVELLVYPAVLFGDHGIAVSNGRQTADVLGGLGPGADPVAVLSKALAGWDYEPDAPIFTPRVSGCLAGGRAGLSVVRRGPSGESLRSFFAVEPREGEGRLVSTYAGPNADPPPAFEGEPRRVAIDGGSAAETAAAAYRELGPGPAGKDFRVAVACVCVPASGRGAPDVHIVNRHERT